MPDNPAEVVAFARALILECGRLLREKREGSAIEICEKNGHTDIVTDHDLWAQEFLADRIFDRYPDHGLISEEGAVKATECPWTWIIDPIDGTTNYVSIKKHYAISIGLYYDDEPFYGLVLDVSLGYLFEAPYTKIEAEESVQATPQESIAFASHHTMMFLKEKGLDPLGFLGRYQGVRSLGCASLELCQLAAGGNGIYISSQLKLWDFAAAECVLSQSGAAFLAKPMPGGRYFVIASSSKALLSDCLLAMPSPVQNLFDDYGGKRYAGD